MIVDVYLSLGSNIDPYRNLPRAVKLLAEKLTLHAVSRVYESPPLDTAGQVDNTQEPFLNAAALIETDLSPATLKYDMLRPLEKQLGRVRSGDKYAPRPIDFDIALYGQHIIADIENNITIPDPEILTRAHVALPLADLAPDYLHPIQGVPLKIIAARFAGAETITLSPLTLEI